MGGGAETGQGGGWRWQYRRQPAGGLLAAVDGKSGMAVTELPSRVEARVAAALVELETLKAEVAELAALAFTPRSQQGIGGALQLLTVGQTSHSDVRAACSARDGEPG